MKQDEHSGGVSKVLFCERISLWPTGLVLIGDTFGKRTCTTYTQKVDKSGTFAARGEGEVTRDVR